ncbi:MAG: ImmA/IrrE family metallo-endopeptidase [Clostridium sp.]|nr:ImmA/IrrE family metallo-endopeptidase [Clostridium sp.]
MDEIFEIASKIKRLETCGELRIVYINEIGPKALVMSNTDKFVIAIDPSLSWEQQIKELWHEAKHIYSHLNNINCSIDIAEKEATNFSNKAMNNIELFNKLRNID